MNILLHQCVKLLSEWIVLLAVPRPPRELLPTALTMWDGIMDQAQRDTALFEVLLPVRSKLHDAQADSPAYGSLRAQLVKIGKVTPDQLARIVLMNDLLVTMRKCKLSLTSFDRTFDSTSPAATNAGSAKVA